MYYFMSFLVLQYLDEEQRSGCFVVSVFWMPCYCKCLVAFPRGPVGWSAVCECGMY